MSQINRNFNLILAESKLENKRFQNNRNRQKSESRETGIFETELEMSSYKKRGIKFFYKSSHQRCSMRKTVLKILQYSLETSCAGVP